MNRNKLLCLAAFSVLAAVSNVAKADDYSYPVIDYKGMKVDRNFERVNCAQASQFAWFQREIARGEGMPANVIDVPAECQRQLVAKSSSEEDLADALNAAIDAE